MEGVQTPKRMEPTLRVDKAQCLFKESYLCGSRSDLFQVCQRTVQWDGNIYTQGIIYDLPHPKHWLLGCCNATTDTNKDMQNRNIRYIYTPYIKNAFIQYDCYYAQNFAKSHASPVNPRLPKYLSFIPRLQ